MATTPYNFVSLPTKPLPHPLVNSCSEWLTLGKTTCQNEFAKFISEHGLYTGYIKLNIKTLSPCFIGGEMKNDIRLFFTSGHQPDGTPVIPGSSIRGMVKNIFKIITCGTMRANEDFADKHLYFRKIMATTKDKSDDLLREHYELLTDKNGQGTKPGFLIRTKGKGEYFICPAFCEMSESIPPDNDKKKWMGYITFNSNEQSADCITGVIPNRQRINKQHRHRIQKGDFRPAKRIPMDPDLNVIENYEADKTRRGLCLLNSRYTLKGGAARGFTKQNDINWIVPCFYTEKNGFVQNFGHGPHYRVPYLTSIAEHISEKLLASDHPIDFADMVFGHKDYWASRVFFEDAKPISSEAVKTDNFGYTRPLMTPNPTSYQLYLEQNGSNVGKKHWDVPHVNIRGYKFYWHRLGENKEDSWMKTEDQKIVKGMTKIKPIKKGAEFHSRIRFENLSREELGALYSAISFERGNHRIAYKIGMGKSIGMGSIIIEPKLFIEDMDMHYCQLFADDNSGWKQEIHEQTPQSFVDSFHQYRNKTLGQDEITKIEKSLDELAELLDCTDKDTAEWLKKTAMMRIDKGDKRFINRISLLETLEFAKGKLK